MGIIWDIIKDIPTAANLRDKVQDLETKNIALEADNGMLTRKLEKAEREVKRLQNEKAAKPSTSSTATKLPGVSEKILGAFLQFSDTSELGEYALYHASEVDRVTFDFHLDELESEDYLRLSHTDFNEGHFYILSQKGRKYVLQYLKKPKDSEEPG